MQRAKSECGKTQRASSLGRVLTCRAGYWRSPSDLLPLDFGVGVLSCPLRASPSPAGQPRERFFCLGFAACSYLSSYVATPYSVRSIFHPDHAQNLNRLGC